MISRSMWKDPIYEAMDELSKIILPYHMQDQEELVELLSTPMVVKPEHIVNAIRNAFTRGVEDVVRHRIDAEIMRLEESNSRIRIRSKWRYVVNYIACTKRYEIDLPREIVFSYDCYGNPKVEKGEECTLTVMFNVDKAMVTMAISDNRNELYSALAVKSQKGMVMRLRTLCDIFGQTDKKDRGTKQLADAAGTAIIKAFERSDIRSNVVFNQAIEHIDAWLQHESLSSVTWLRALKARMSLGESIYSMELK